MTDESGARDQEATGSDSAATEGGTASLRERVIGGALGAPEGEGEEARWVACVRSSRSRSSEWSSGGGDPLEGCSEISPRRGTPIKCRTWEIVKSGFESR